MDSEILFETFSDEEEDGENGDANNVDKLSPNNNGTNSDDVPQASNDDGGDQLNCSKVSNESDSGAAEIRKLLRRKDELERKQKMQERHNQRLQVSELFD